VKPVAVSTELGSDAVLVSDGKVYKLKGKADDVLLSADPGQGIVVAQGRVSFQFMLAPDWVKSTLTVTAKQDRFKVRHTNIEREVNGILRRFHDDVATIRRELIATKKLLRTRNGVYKRAGATEAALRRG